MATRQFALPLNAKSIQVGAIKFDALTDANVQAAFCLSNVVAALTNQLNLVTRSGGSSKSHVFTATVTSGVATATLSHSDLATINDEASGGEWDYVEATWTVGEINMPGASSMTAVQSGVAYNLFGWPPKQT